MARAKRASDELYNARRRVRRLADRYERKGDTSMAAGLRDLAKVGRGATIETLNSAYQAGNVQLDRTPRAATKGTSRTSSAMPTTTRPAAPAKAQAPTVARQSRPKRASDELYNARRRLKRQAEKIEREAKTATTEAAREAALGYAKYLRQQAKPTGKLTSEQRQQALERLGRIRERTRGITYDPFKVRRRNAILMQQINAAGTEGAESSISERKKDVFWAATKGLWPKGSNVPRNERYDRILEHFYTEDTTDAKDFRAWLEEKKGTTAQESFGDLQLVYEYITEELNDPAEYDLPELPYETAMSLIITAM